MIAVTGTGIASPLGAGVADFLARLRSGGSAVRRLDPELGMEVGAKFEIPPDPQLERSQQFLMDPVTQYAVVAAREALAMADLSSLDPSSIGAIMGIGIMGIESADVSYREFFLHDRRPSPFLIAKVMPSAPASGVTMALGIRGPSYCVTSACASSSHAIINAALWLQAGLADAVVVGGAEAPFAPAFLQCWRAMRVIARDTCRPFSLNRSGMVLGEGAAALVLERLEDARARGANILAVLRGFGANADAGHIVQPDSDSVARVMRLALRQADLSPEDIGHINAHGTGTPINDRTEAQAITSVFGSSTPYVSATKAATGHTLGAAGAVEAVISVSGLAQGWIPPILNYLGPDPECAPLNLSTAPAAISFRHSAVLSNSFAFGGLNAVLVFSSE